MGQDNSSLSDSVPLILVADDDRSMRTLLNLAIEEEGYRVVEAKDGEQCLAEYKRCQPDMVLLDAVMPQMDGFTCCQHLRQLPGGARLPILMITVLDDQESVDQAFASGATDYVTKPIHWGVLSQRMRRLLSAARTEEQLQQQLTWETLFRSILQRLAQKSALYDILPDILPEIQQFFNLQRLFFLQRESQLCIEAVQPDNPSVKGLSWEIISWGSCSDTQYQQGKIITVADIHQAGFPKAIIAQLTALQTQALLLAPLIVQGKLWGLLGAHQSQVLPCWQQADIERLSDVANLLAIALNCPQQETAASRVFLPESSKRLIKKIQGLLTSTPTDKGLP